jgi:hypothetical protein
MRRIVCVVLVAIAGCGSAGSSPAVDLAATADLNPLGAVGAPCTDGTQCATGQCITEAMHSLYVGGYCSIVMCTTCPAGSYCAGGGGIGALGCFEECTPGAACRTGYKCCPIPTDLGGQGLCVPASGTGLSC